MRSKNAITILAIIGLLAGLILGSSAAHALCLSSEEDGDWVNYDPNTRGITKIFVRFHCRDVSLNGETEAFPYHLRLFGSCHPTDCDWGWVGATYGPSGWIRTTIYHGFATRYVWVRAYPGYSRDWLRVWIWTDFSNPNRQDYASDSWFNRA